MRLVSRQCLEPVQCGLVNLARAKLLDELVVVDAVLVRRNNFPRIDDLLAFLDVGVLAVLAEVCVSFGLRVFVERHSGKNWERMPGLHGGTQPGYLLSQRISVFVRDCGDCGDDSTKHHPHQKLLPICAHSPRVSFCSFVAQNTHPDKSIVD
jgi:hypothetical protein